MLSAAAALSSASAAAPAPATAAATPPNIVFLLSDDVGFNDYSLHGSPQIPTPNFDAIGARGIILDRLYVQPVCSPTRASFMTGRHVIHTGIYDPFAHGEDNEHLNLNFTLLPRYLSTCCGYTPRMVGKWHLGANSLAATPTGRGFASHFGFAVGEEDHVDHSVCCANKTKSVYDFTDDLEPAVAFNGTDSTTAFAARAVELLRAQAALGPAAPPLFLYVAFQDTHVPLEASPELIARCMANNATGGDEKRATICGMALLLDEAIGNITAALAETGLDKNTIVIAHSDNGGPVEGGFFNNNFPLRGGKASLWQVRARGRAGEGAVATRPPSPPTAPPLLPHPRVASGPRASWRGRACPRAAPTSRRTCT